MTTLDDVTHALVILAELGVPPDVQELLVRGDPDRGVSSGALLKVVESIRRDTFTRRQMLGEVSRRLDQALAARDALDYDVRELTHAWPMITRRIRSMAIEEAATYVAEGITLKDRGIDSKHDKCAHDLYGWEDCEQCSVSALRRLAREIDKER